MPRKKGSTNRTPSEIERAGKALMEQAKLRKKIKALQEKIKSRK